MPLAGYGGSVLITSSTNASLTDEVLTDSGDHKTFNISSASFAAKRYWDRTVAPVVQSEYDDVQTVTITGSPTGGTFTLAFNTHTTGTIAFNASASTVQTALEGLSGVGAGQVSVSGSNGGPYTVEWIGTLAFASQTAMTADGSLLTGGTSPSVGVVHTQTGAGYTTQSASTYTVRYVTGQVLFNAAFVGTTVNTRIHSGKYLPFSTFSNMKEWEATPAVDLLDATTFGNGWKVYVPGQAGGDVKLTQFYTDLTFSTLITNRTAFIVSCLTGRNSTERYEAFGYLKGDDIKVAVNALEEEALTYTIDGPFYPFTGQYS